MSCDGVFGGICFLLCLIVLDGAFFSFRPFRAIMWGGVLLCCYPGCYPGLTRLIPFQGIFCSSAEFCFAMGSIFLLKGVIVVLLLVVSLFLPLVDNLIEWAKDNMDEIVEGRRRRGLE